MDHNQSALPRNIIITKLWLQGYKLDSIAALYNISVPRVRQVAIKTASVVMPKHNTEQYTKREQFLPFKNRIFAYLVRWQDLCEYADELNQ